MTQAAPSPNHAQLDHNQHNENRYVIDLLNGVAGAAARHDVGHHALKESQRRSRARVGGQRGFQRLPQQVSIELREQLPVRLACAANIASMGVSLS